MASVTFSHVPAEAYDSLAKELQAQPWVGVDVSAYAGPGQTPLRPLHDAPGLVLCKLRLVWACERHAAARKGAGSAKDLDQNWDNTQRRLIAKLDFLATDADARIRDAAARVRQRLTDGAGTAQTRLSYQQEVDFGHRQLTLAAEECAADIQLLDLGTIIDEIRTSTQALAESIAHGENNQPPARRLRTAAAECAAACAHVHAHLEWLENHGQAGVDTSLAAKLKASLTALAARYPAPSSSSAAGEDTTADEDAGTEDETAPASE